MSAPQTVGFESLYLMWALAIATQGFPVFPIWEPLSGGCACANGAPCKKGEGQAGKHPRTHHGHKDATTDPAIVRAWWTTDAANAHPGIEAWQRGSESNIGIAVPDGILVVDVDPRNGGVESFDAQENAGHKFPETRSVQTGSGGAHFYYRVPAGFAFPKNLDELGTPGIDLKGFGSYVLAPPSLHRSGGRYSGAFNEPIAAAPAWLLELAKPRGQGATYEDVVHGEPTSGVDHTAVIALLAPHFVEGRKHHMSVALGGFLKKRGYTTGDAALIIGRLPSKNPPARVADACSAWRVTNPVGYSALAAILSPDVLAELARLLPDRPDPDMDPKWTDALPQNQNAIVVAGTVFDALAFGAELNRAATQCRDKTLRPALESLVKGEAFDAALAPELAKKLAEKFQSFTASDMALALRPSLEMTGLAVEAFSQAIQHQKDAVPSRAQNWTFGLDRDDKGNLKPHVANVIAVLQQHPDWLGRFAYDELKQDCIYSTDDGALKAWGDTENTCLRAWLINKARFTPSKDDVRDAVVLVAKQTRSHPVQVYLGSLAWDGTPRIDRWLETYCAAEGNAYARAVGAKFLIAAVARAYKPGCKVDTMLVLQGRQGVRKSTTFASLVPDPAWYSDTALDLKNRKDAALQLFGKWIYEVGELHGFSKEDANRVKGFMSSCTDNVRAPYASRNEDFARGCVLGGTTNEDTYLTDETGNRRFWPVNVGPCSVEELARDRDQLWAEAVQRYRANEPWWLDSDHEALAKVEQDARLVEDAWTPKLAAWFENPMTAPGTVFDLSKGVTTTDVLTYALGLDNSRQDRGAVTRAGNALKQLGWIVGSKRERDEDGRLKSRRYFRRS